MRFCIRMSIILTIVFLMISAGIPCRAIEDDPADSLQQAADSLAIPAEIDAELSRLGIEPGQPESLLTLSP